MELTATKRRELAQKVGVNEQYLYQCLKGIRTMSAEEAVRVERESDGVLRRWHLRADWPRIWPELINTVGAPAIPQAA